MYPPEYHQVDSHRYVINQRIAEMKHNFKIDESNDPREEVNFFEESCEVNEIYNPHDRYKILTSVWPPNDIKNYWATTYSEDKCYKTLKKFLANRDGQLGRIFRAKPDWHTVSGLSLDLEVRKWETELKKKDSLTKFLYIHLAPKEIKSKVKQKLLLDIDTFKSHCKNVCDINDQKKKEEANNFHYWGNPNKVVRHNRQKQSNYQKRNQDYGYQSKNYDFSNQQPRAYMNQNNNGNVSESQICPRHKTYRENANKCDWPKICKMADIIKPYEPKNGLPSSSQ